jgi:large subunit ribosomal protein L15
MTLFNLSSKLGKKKKKLLGRGNGSGHGTFCCRGGKGQSARSGGSIRPGFEGGQTTMLRRMPKLRGFKNPNHQEFQVVNVVDLNCFDNNEEVTVEKLFAKKLISKKNQPVKLLGNGELEKTLTVTVSKASASAIEAIQAKKGKVILLPSKPPLEKPAHNA